MVFFLCAILLVVVIIAVIVFVGSKAFRIFSEGGNPKTFFTVDNWDPTGENGTPAYGAFGLILGSIVTTLGAMMIVTPLSLGTAVFFTEMAPNWLVRFLKPLIEIFTGVPSVVIGVLGLTVLVPFLTRVAAPITGGSQTGGYGWGAAILVLA